MTDLFDKHRAIAERHERMLSLGVNAVSLTNDRILSPTRAIIDGRETVLAGTNNYMGITFDPDCIAAGQEAMALYGTGTTGSRIANGSYSMHRDLEKELAGFLNRKHCIMFTTGYQANLGMLAGLAGPKDTIYLDADSHSSIYDGCTLSGAKLVRFRHNDAGDLDKRLARSEDEGGRLVVLEGIYSMLGDRAPLAEFVEVKKKHGFQLLVDEAHSFGVLGKNGRGLADEAGLEDDVDFVVGTFSKSIGAIGGFGAGNHPLFNMLRYASRPYMFTASPSPATVATALAAIRKLRAEPERRERLSVNSARLFNGFKSLGLALGCDSVSPIVAVHCPDEVSTISMWNALLTAGVYVNIALPPGTPGKQCLLRCSVSAAHTFEEIDRIIALFGEVVAQGLYKKAV
ncbi:aminotransferase class I/II-fold pyridoxal phosphate-dependent enzyme [Nordella sp. HKS 07]|uniref:serine palmitoyltransferase n=1 Tax=Nordella sp. HKS 07 TaxID=2712222 RepID=UPI0013E14A9E|nr:aminotransferase class I/II-fold pyridoxal phosphate-dependent enzyme [Nordella sp. HKS 07]QIG46540.1 aminotransferase class I/II-fold pyridoxal phosphate-dependent enzyme [Nordella sp. HKS 07]